jgi:hypothetical protein
VLPTLVAALRSFEKCKQIPEDKRVKKCLEFSQKVKKALDKVYEIVDKDDFFNIGLIKDHILNPQSHNDFTRPLYKKELEDAFKSVEMLQRAVEQNILHRMQQKRVALSKRRRRPLERRKIR